MHWTVVNQENRKEGQVTNLSDRWCGTSSKNPLNGKTKVCFELWYSKGYCYIFVNKSVQVKSQ